MDEDTGRVCPAAMAASLDNRFRRWFQNPSKILAPYLRVGMTMLDLGCGPGFFSVEAAVMVGETGRVIAADLQEGMLKRLEKKISDTELADRISLHKCSEDRIGLDETVDLVLAFYVVHEIPDRAGLFEELASLLSPGGRILIVEPPLHVTKAAFARTLAAAEQAGLQHEEGPKMTFSKTAVLRKV